MKKELCFLFKKALRAKNLFLTACLLLATMPAFSQTGTLTGSVTDTSGSPLIGVSIVVQGTSNGVITDIDGKYSLTNVPQNATISYSYIGMLSQNVKVNGRSVINITLKEDSKQLEEVVVIGYGSAKSKDLTAPIDVVKEKELINIPTSKGQHGNH